MTGLQQFFLQSIETCVASLFQKGAFKYFIFYLHFILKKFKCEKTATSKQKERTVKWLFTLTQAIYLKKSVFILLLHEI